MQQIEPIDINSKITHQLINKSIANNRFLLQQLINNQSQFGCIYKGIEIQTFQTVAIKVIPKSKLKEIPILKRLISNEIESLKKCNSPNVLKYIFDCQTDLNFYIVTEYCNGGDLYNLIKSRKYINQTEALEMFCQILEGYKELHIKGIAHRDIKPQNILINNGVLKIADFGFSHMYDPNQVNKDTDIFQTCLGSPLFMAPEILLNQPYGIKSDIYSLGVLFYVMLLGVFPYYYSNQNKSDNDLAMIIKNTPLTFLQAIYLSENIKDLLRKMIQFDPKNRIGFNDLYLHPSITQILNPIILVSPVRNGVQAQAFKQSQQLYSVQENTINQQMIQQQEQQNGNELKDIEQMDEKQFDAPDEIIGENFLKNEQINECVRFIQTICREEINTYIYIAQTLYGLSSNLINLQKVDMKRILNDCYYMMLYGLCLSWKNVENGLKQDKNIFKSNNFEILKNLPEYKGFLNEVLQVHYEMIQNYEKWELGEFLKYKNKITNKNVLQCLDQQEINDIFINSYQQLIKKLYEHIKKSIKNENKVELEMQLRVGQCYDIKQFFKGIDLLEYQSIFNQNMQSNQWNEFLEKELLKAEQLMS